MTSITAYAEKLTDEEIKDKHPQVAIRSGGDEDVPFIFARALADLRYADFVRQVPDRHFHTYVHKLLEHHIYDGQVLVACAEHDRDDILGFLIFRETSIGLMVVYAYVRKDRYGPNYRQQGILRKLVEATGWVEGERITYLIRTPIFRFAPSFRGRIDEDPNIEHNIFPLFTLLDTGWEHRRPGEK